MSYYTLHARIVSFLLLTCHLRINTHPIDLVSQNNVHVLRGWSKLFVETYYFGGGGLSLAFTQKLLSLAHSMTLEGGGGGVNL